MSRSIKKGPFAAPELLKRVDEMNKAGSKQVITPQPGILHRDFSEEEVDMVSVLQSVDKVWL